MGQAYLMRRVVAGSSGGIALNMSVVPTSVPPPTPKHNMILLETFDSIPEWAAAEENPYIDYKDTDILEGAAIEPGYISDSGGNVAQSSTRVELRTVDHFPVEYGKSYTYSCEYSSDREYWVAICEYKANGSFYKRITNGGTGGVGSIVSGTYTPSSSSITSIRISWRTFNDSACTMRFVAPSVPYTIEGTPDGAVWVKSGFSPVEINAINTNKIIIKPSACLMYVGGEWVDVPARVYQNGEWRELTWYLLKHGVQYPDFTGGWTAAAKQAASNSSAEAKQPIVTCFNEGFDDGYTWVETKTDIGAGMYYTVEKIDLTPFQTVVFEGDFTRGGTVARNFTAAVWSSIGTYYASNMLAYTQPTDAEFERVEIDISNVNAEAYIGLGLTQSEALIKKVYLVPKEETA